MPAKNPRTTSEPITLQEAIRFFADENRAHYYLTARRWPDGNVACPTCGSTAVLYMAKYRRWKCGSDHAKRQFSVKVGTVMEDSPLPLGKWLMAMWMVANCKNGVSSYEIHRAIDVTQKSAWFMLQRIRLAMQSAQGGGKLGDEFGGTVEVDETFIGGKARNMHRGVRARKVPKPGGYTGKAIVMGLLDRKNSKVRARQVPNTRYKTLSAEIRTHVTRGSNLYTDHNPSYRDIELDYRHQAVNHAAEEYVRGQVHTNGIENFWSLLKRAIRGTYVSVEPFHLFRYVDEQAFRFNERRDEEGDRGRFQTLLGFVDGKRLTYKQLIARDEPSAAAPA